MLEFIRKNTRITQIILLIFIIPSFVFVGVEGYQRMGNANAVAKVGSTHISQEEWDQAQREQAEELRQRAGAQFDPKWIESADFKWAVLENMIAERVISSEIKQNLLTVDEQIVLQKIREIPGLVGPDGKLDEKRYKEALAAKGISPEMHFFMVHQSLVQQQIGAPVQYSTFVPLQVTERVWSLIEQERDVQKLLFKLDDFRSLAKVTDEEMKLFHEQNAALFTVPEHIDAEVAVLDMSIVQASIKISDADIKSYYDQNVARFSVPEERRVKHILIAVNKDASEADRAAAKAKAEGVLAKVKQDPSSFSAVAKEHSQDPGSAKNGGDLGFFTKGKMVKPFDDAAFLLKKGEISDLVQTDFGYHILTIVEIKPEVVKSLAEVKPLVVAEVKAQLANKKYIELAEIFSNMVYEQPDSLQPAAEKLGLKIHKLPTFTREQDPANKHPLLSNQKFMQAIFSDDVIKNKHNTETIEIEPQVMIAARVLKHYPAQVRPFDEVKKSIHERLILNKAMTLASEASEAQLQKLQAGEEIKGFSAPLIISRQKINASGRFEQLAAMQVNTDKLPAFVRVNDPQGFAIYRINKVITPKATDPNMRELIRKELLSAETRREMMAYISYLKETSKVEILKKSTDAAAGDKKEAAPESNTGKKEAATETK